MKVKVIFLSLVLAVAFSNVNATLSPTALFMKHRFDQVLRGQDLNSKADLTVCYSYYSELMQKLLEKYDADKKLCDETKASEISELSNAAQQSRDAITESLTAVCANLQTCKDDPDNLEFFDCVSESGDPSTRDIWKASRDSSEKAAQIREEERAIEFKNEKCTSEAERNYIKGTAQATEDMMNCYKNGGTTASPVEPEE